MAPTLSFGCCSFSDLEEANGLVEGAILPKTRCQARLVFERGEHFRQVKYNLAVASMKD